jgi:hypothetical protein
MNSDTLTCSSGYRAAFALPKREAVILEEVKPKKLAICGFIGVILLRPNRRSKPIIFSN